MRAPKEESERYAAPPNEQNFDIAAVIAGESLGLLHDIASVRSVVEKVTAPATDRLTRGGQGRDSARPNRDGVINPARWGAVRWSAAAGAGESLDTSARRSKRRPWESSSALARPRLSCRLWNESTRSIWESGSPC